MSDNGIPFPKKKKTEEELMVELLEALGIPCDRCGEILCDGFCNEE